MYQNQASPSHNLTTGDELLLQLPITILGYPLYTGHSQHNTPINVVSVRGHPNGVRGHFARFPPASHFGPIMPTTLGKTPPPGWTSPDHAKEQTDAARGSTQGAAEY